MEVFNMKKYTELILKKITMLVLFLTLLLPIVHPFRVKAYETLSNKSWFEGSFIDVIFKEATFDLDLNPFINDLYIYSYDSYKDYKGDYKQTTVAYNLTGNSNYNIYIGNTNNEYAKEKDIKIYLENVSLGDNNSMNIYPVFTDNLYKVEIINEKNQIFLHLSLKKMLLLALN